MKLSPNLAYIVIFLRNGGERLRAIRLAKDWFNIGIPEAKTWVDTVHMISVPVQKYVDYSDNEEVKDVCMETASHWPESVILELKDKASV